MNYNYVYEILYSGSVYKTMTMNLYNKDNLTFDLISTVRIKTPPTYVISNTMLKLYLTVGKY